MLKHQAMIFAIKALFAYIPILLGCDFNCADVLHDLIKITRDCKKKIFKNVLKDYQNNKIYGEMPSAFSLIPKLVWDKKTNF